jgi:hypothetical protein
VAADCQMHTGHPSPEGRCDREMAWPQGRDHLQQPLKGRGGTGEVSQHLHHSAPLTLVVPAMYKVPNTK